VDLCRLAGLYPAGVICEVMNGDGTMARRADLKEFSARHDIKIVAIKDLIAYRRRTEKLVAPRVVANVPVHDRAWRAYAYEDLVTGEVHLAMVLGEIDPSQPVLLRVHSRCLTGDVFGSQRCDCGPQLEAALGLIAEAGMGVIVYLRGHEGRGIGLAHKLRAYSLQEQGLDTVDANVELGLPVDSREYGIGAQILVDLGITTMRYMTNNPAKYGGLEGFGLEMVERVPLVSEPTPHNIAYLRTKRERMGHLLEGIDDVL
jgi:3,4-dihydroxy 2-butanone 4-phosphate synthase/GTP cyclohydrolase II